MNDMRGVIQIWLKRAAFWCVLAVFGSSPSDAMDRSHHGDTEAGGAKLSFLSRPADETQPPAAETLPSVTLPENKNFDGVWTFTSAGCPYTGSLPARIVDGKIFVRGGSGQVDPDGTLHSVGAGNGMTPYRRRTIVGKYRLGNLQSVRRLYRSLGRYQAGNAAPTPTLGRLTGSIPRASAKSG
jgi:hypothetical protein